MESLLKLIALLVALFFLAMFFFKVYIKKRSKGLEGKGVGLVRNGLVYFYSERCGACKMMKPQVEKLKERLEVMEVDVGKSEGQKVAKEFGVMATPTTFLVKDGIIKKVFVGFVRSEKILEEV
ncbi:MAG: thioredoxin family protein [Aquificaceae bacterium]